MRQNPVDSPEAAIQVLREFMSRYTDRVSPKQFEAILKSLGLKALNALMLGRPQKIAQVTEGWYARPGLAYKGWRRAEI